LKGKIVHSFEGHARAISCVAILPDGRIVSGSNDRTLKIWNLQTGKCDMIFTGHTDWVNCVAVYVSQKQLADSLIDRVHLDGCIISGSDDATVKIFNIQTGKCDITFTGHTNTVNCVAVLSDGRIVSGSDDRTIKIWNPQTGICDINLTGHTDGVMCITVDNSKVIHQLFRLDL
jgi:WD40 repeat protein